MTTTGTDPATRRGAGGIERRTAAVTAAAAAVTFAAGLLGVSVEPPDTITAATLRDLFADRETTFALSAVGGGVGAVALLVLVAGLCRLVRRRDPDAGMLPDVAALAAAVVAVDGLLWAGVHLIPVVKDTAAATDAEILGWWSFTGFAEAMGDLGTLPRGLLLVTVSLAALRPRVLPRWLAWFGVVIGTAALVSPVGLVTGWTPFGVLFMSGLFGFLVWPLAVAVSLAWSARRRRTPATP
jgi:hypothetical protein